MKLILPFLFFLTACATRYILPGNRFLTPESQGSTFRGQIEVQQTTAPLLNIKTDQAPSNSGVVYSDISRTGFLFSNSLIDSFDVIWSHTGAGNSMFGGKFQVLGGSRTANATGHKLAFGALVGGNDHETEESDSVEFSLKGKEYLALYGYRMSENFLPYLGLSFSTYDFNGVVSSSDPIINGFRPSTKTELITLSGGFEIGYGAFFGKVEAAYQQLKTTHTKAKDRSSFGYSIGYQW